MEENPYRSPVSEGAPTQGREWWRFVLCILLAAFATPFLLMTLVGCAATAVALYQLDFSAFAFSGVVLLVSGAVTVGLLILARRCFP